MNCKICGNDFKRNSNRQKYCTRLDCKKKVTHQQYLTYRKKWAEEHRDQLNKQNRLNHHKRMKNPLFVIKERERNRKRELKLKIEVFTHYSNGIPKCACCNENIIEFLALDHINNNGAEDRKKGLHGAVMYRYVRKNNYPEGFQVLCHNCNQARGQDKNNICPHNLK